ncbi:MAG: DUF2723 domain-containing protein [Chloroflexi bacterium]|nr:DUF2723 domain-containing protein [Chloroflexota bacterium]
MASEKEMTGAAAGREWGPLAWGLAVVALSGLLFGLTAARDIVVGDNAEFMVAAARLSNAHPPGYPLLTLLAHLFSRIPAGPLPFRMNVLAVACNTAAVGLVYLTSLHLTRRPAASAIAAALLAFSPLFWGWALVLETFPLNNLLAAALIYLLVRWHGSPRRTWLLVAVAFIGGLALANQQTVLLLGPAVLWLLWRQRAALLARPVVLALCAGAACLGLLPYVYLPWAANHHPVSGWAPLSSLADFWNYVTRKAYGTWQLIPASEQGGSRWHLLRASLTSFSHVEGTFAILGAIQAYRRLRWYFWFAALAFIATGPLFAVMSRVDLSLLDARWFLSRFFLLAHVSVAPLMALGILSIAEAITGIVQRGRAQVAGVAVLVASLGLAVFQIVSTYGSVDQSGNHVARNYAEDVLISAPPRSLLLVWRDYNSAPLEYLQEVEHQRSDVTVIDEGRLPSDPYVRYVRAQHPDVVLPLGYDGKSVTLKSIVDANPGRLIAEIGPLRDDSLDNGYTFFTVGMANRVLRTGSQVDAAAYAQENERLFRLLRPPSRGEIKAETAEGVILQVYSRQFCNVAQALDSAGQHEQADQWFRRSAAVDAGFSVARPECAERSSR